MIKIWKWIDAPKNYKALSSHGGGEDWVVYIPFEYTQDMIVRDTFGLDEDYVTFWGHTDVIDLMTDDVIVIFAHA